MPRGKTTQSMRRILQSFAVRNQRLGYCQGLDYLVLFLLAFHLPTQKKYDATGLVLDKNAKQPVPPGINPDAGEGAPTSYVVEDGDERVFWTLCGIVEKLLPEDFFDPPPAMLNGFLVEQRLLISLAQRTFSKLHSVVGEETFRQTIELLSHKWSSLISNGFFGASTVVLLTAFLIHFLFLLRTHHRFRLITLFVDCSPLKVICMVWQSFFTREGERILSRVLSPEPFI